MAPIADTREPNYALVAALRQHGLTQDELASRINNEIALMFGQSASCSAPQVRRWTSGAVQWPHPQYLLALEMILDKSPLDLGFTPRGKGSMEHLAEVRGAILPNYDTTQRGTVQRRQFMSAVAGAAVAASGHHVHGNHIGVSQVQELQGRVAELHALDGKFGGTDLVRLATHGYNAVSSTLSSCTYSEQTSRRLYALAGEFATSAGWFAFDSGHQDEAERQYNLALKLALMADDDVLQAHVLIAMALQALQMGNPAECAAISRAALDQKGARRSPLVAALFHSRLGIALAHQSDGRQSARSFTKAESLIQSENSGPPTPPWLTFFGSGELSGLIAQGALALGDYDVAEGSAAASTEAIDSRFARNRFMHTLTQAQAQLGQRDIEKACATTATALSVAPRVRSERAKVTLSILRRKLSEQPSTAARNLLSTWDEPGAMAR